ncbi:MAG: phospho-N-acetylmuramoyl-pentapeptide-transferase [Acetobacteraceae bacterium]|nr:phospho-N-acetylmuramoyl-pentapeptide-transferase [Acetobacteraceae bacterium]
MSWGAAAAAFGLSLLVSLALGPVALPILSRLRLGQRVRSDGPARHLGKQGTPTMGGLVFLVGILVSSLAVAPRNLYLLGVLLVTVGFALLGFLDDFIKVVRRRPLGLRARYKILGQVVLGLVLSALVMGPLGGEGRVALPFCRLALDLGPLYVGFVVLVLMGAANAANLTDGLDGLLAGVALVAYAAYAVLAMWAGRTELALFSLAAAGGCAGFLPYNRHPARMFMGDTGSLALGGGLGAVAVLTGTELLLPIVGGVLVVEALSVMLQVLAFQAFGRRLFRMSPLHHHFELGGWPEARVVRAFWAAGVALAAVGLLGAGWWGWAG